MRLTVLKLSQNLLNPEHLLFGLTPNPIIRLLRFLLLACVLQLPRLLLLDRLICACCFFLLFCLQGNDDICPMTSICLISHEVFTTGI